MESKYWETYDRPQNDPLWTRVSAPNFGDNLPCQEVHAELFPIGVDVFFPTNDKYPENDLEVRAAKDACARCHMQDECLQYALASGVTDGIWGGTTPPERERLRRKLGIRYDVH